MTRRGSYLMGIDIGSSDCKVMLVDLQGRIIARSRDSYPTRYPRLGWAEQDPEDWYRTTCRAVRMCLEHSSFQPQEIVALSIDGPAHNVAFMGDRGQIIYPTIHWSDLRSIAQSEYLERTDGRRIFEISNATPNPSYTLSQILWLKQEEPAVWSKLSRILATKDYVRYRFTGQYQTDVYDAIGTQLYDPYTGRWSDELCNLVGLNPCQLPTVEPAHTISGELLPEAARDAGLCPGIPVAVGSGDSVVEAAGIGALRAGQGVVKLGTSANVNLVTAEPFPSRKSITYRHVAAPYWFTITATNAGASTVRWFHEVFCRHEAEPQGENAPWAHTLIDDLAQTAPAGSEGLLFHPYLMGERTPYWDPHLRGNFFGIRAGHGLAHFARALLEGVAFSIRDCLRVVQELGQPLERLYLIGGGAKSCLWRQVIADVVGQELVKPSVEDAAYGAALLAGIAVSAFSDWEQAVSSCVRSDEIVSPNPALRERYDALFDVYQGIARDLITHSHRLTQIADTWTGLNV